MPCAALAAEHLLPGEGHDIELVEMAASWAKAAEVASQMVRPARSAGIASPVRHTHAGRGAVPGEHHVMRSGFDRRDRSGKNAIGRLRCSPTSSASFNCLTDIGHPSGLPKDSQASRSAQAARAEQRPQRHFHGAGIGGRHDADAVAVRHTGGCRGSCRWPA